MARIFISHSSRDAKQAERLLAWLKDHGFDQAFLDFDKHAGIPAGAEWEKTLYRELVRAEAVLLIVTKNWFESTWCFVEFAQARALGKAIFPLIETPKGETFIARDIQSLDLTKDRDGGLERLGAELTRIALNAQGEFSWDATRSPFPGLLAFDAADAAVYFGRDDDIRRLIERLNARRAQGGARLIALLGASGSGKSSLMRGGLMPRLKRDQHNWIVLPPFRPQLQPLDELCMAIAIALGKPAGWRIWRRRLSNKNSSRHLLDLSRELRTTHGRNEAQILVTIDQGEELFGVADKAAADRLFTLLNGMLDDSLPFFVLLALRSDYLDQLQQAPGLGASFEDYSLRPIPRSRMGEIIAGPARVAGLAMDKMLISAALEDATTEDSLPLLAFALRELYDRFGKHHHYTLADFRSLGDEKEGLSPLENAVRRCAEDVLSKGTLLPSDLQALKEAFVPAMVRINADGEYMRRPARFDDLPKAAQPLLKRLAQARLLVIRQEGGERRIEVAHDALLRKWPLLRALLDEEKVFLSDLERIAGVRDFWAQAPSEAKAGALLSGLLLARARDWRKRYSHRFTTGETEALGRFIEISEKAEDKERAQANALHDQALSMQSRYLADLASAKRVRGDYRTAIALALEALPDERRGIVRPYVPAAELVLYRSIINLQDHLLRKGESISQLRVPLRGHKAQINSVAFSNDGQFVVTASEDKTARIWDAANRATIAEFQHDSHVKSAAFSPEGNYLVTGLTDHTARLWDIESGKEIAVLRGHVDVVNTAVFSPDGRCILTSSLDATARIWDAMSANCTAQIRGHDGAVSSAKFSSDGSRVVTASEDKTARVWDCENATEIAVFRGHTLGVSSASFSFDQQYVVTGSGDLTARIWNAETGESVTVLGGENRRTGGSINTASFSPDGRRVLTASGDSMARIRESDERI